MRTVRFTDLGQMDYKACWDLQEELFGANCAIKLENRRRNDGMENPTTDYLLFVEHPHVYTLGKSGDLQNLLLDEEGLKKAGAAFYPINRGGDITYHGPGQIVGYPIFDLEHYFTDIHKFLRYLEEAIIRTLACYGIEAGRIEGLTGVWIDPEEENRARKIAALGVKCSRWVTMHGFAFNVNTDMQYFSHIIPCGIDDKAVTSMQAELGKETDMEEVKQVLKEEIGKLFAIQLEYAPAIPVHPI